MIKTLKEELSDWTDLDIACYIVVKIFGMIDYDEQYSKNKWLYYSSNEVSESIYDLIYSLADVGFLELNDDKLKVRYRNQFTLEEIE